MMASKSALEWGLTILENLPQGIKTLGDLKKLFMEFYGDVGTTHSSETTVDDLRSSIQTKLDRIEGRSEDIQEASSEE